jgi:hypothetical protein
MRLFKGLRCTECGAAFASRVAMSDVEVACFERAHAHGFVVAAHVDPDASPHTLGVSRHFHELPGIPGVAFDEIATARSLGVRAATVEEQHAMPGAHEPAKAVTRRRPPRPRPESAS